MKTTALSAALAAVFACSPALAADTPSVDQLWQLVQQQQAEIQALKEALQATRSSVAEQEQQTALTGQKLAETSQQIADTDAVVQSLQDAADSAGKAEWAERTQIGGYGELHYNGGDRDQIDLHRFVLFFGHQFDERTRFNSELEVEHAFSGDGAPGEVEIEQAYVEHDFNGGIRAKAGLFLLPVGILNEVHEPPTFYGVERNPVESQIIPSTWWEAGVAANGEFTPGLGWDAAFHSGLATSAGSNYAVRSGRQKVAEADAKDAAYTLRLRYQAPGLQLATSYQHQDDITQGSDPLAGAADLFTAHAIWNYRGFGLKALWARWELDGAGPAAVGADVQEGFYVEPSFRIGSDWGVFARYSEWDNRAGDAIDSEWRQTDVGLNYWLHANVVLKADYQFQRAPVGRNDDDRINLGIGYQF